MRPHPLRFLRNLRFNDGVSDYEQEARDPWPIPYYELRIRSEYCVSKRIGGMKVLVVGKGGREHALVWKLAQSPRVERVYCAPGNAGTAEDGVNVPIAPTDFDSLIRFAKKESIGLTVIGPDDPLTLGIVDAFQKEGLKVFCPSKEAARLEGSKVFAKKVLHHADVPTAEFRVFDHPDPARQYMETRQYPVVVKADGLAAGKGVLVCSPKQEAFAAIDRIMVREEFGRAAGRPVVIAKHRGVQEP